MDEGPEIKSIWLGYVFWAVVAVLALYLLLRPSETRVPRPGPCNSGVYHSECIYGDYDPSGPEPDRFFGS